MKERMIFRFREGDLTTSGSYFFEMLTPWPLSPFEQAVLYLLKQAKLTRYCQNPSCSTPYFSATAATRDIAPSRVRNLPQREYKRRWWKQHGNQWRRYRAKKRQRRARANLH